jgi:CopG family transcriptional regulator, nickel-responsive regulator
MSELVRFGVAMDRQLLADFDERIATRGYENRSEALRDLVRADLTKAAWEAGERVTGTLTLVFARKQRSEVTRLLEDNASLIIATLGLEVDQDRALDIVAVRGLAGALNALAGRLSGMRGVFNADLTIACVDRRHSPAGKRGETE